MFVPVAEMLWKNGLGNSTAPATLYCVVLMLVMFTRFMTLKPSAINCQRTRSENLISLASRRSTLAYPGPVNMLRPMYGTRELPPTPISPPRIPDGVGLPEVPPEYGRPSASARIPEIWKPFSMARNGRELIPPNGNCHTADMVKRFRW